MSESPTLLTPPLDPEAIVLTAEERLRCSPWLVLHRVACHSNSGVLRLTGRVPTYFLKQVASAAVGNIAGVSQIVNDVEVVKSPGRVLGRK